MKKIIAVALATTGLTISAYAGYTEVDCTTNPKYGEYSCKQCFVGGEVTTTMSNLEDIWTNKTTSDRIMFEEEQTMPVLHKLNGAEFAKEPVDDSKFWEFTSDIKALKDEDLGGSILKAGSNVSWLKSTLGAAYKITKNPTGSNESAMMVYDILTHNYSSGAISDNDTPHKECVLFTSNPITTETPTPKVEKPTPKEMTQVKTGPEHIVLFVLALLAGYIIINRRKIFAK